MRQTRAVADSHASQLEIARQLFFAGRPLPEGMVAPAVLRSWERCLRFGLDDGPDRSGPIPLDRLALKTEQERNRCLLMHGRPIMEHVYEQIRDSGCMVVLADANGLLLETVGDPDFVDRADRVALLAGASWDETLRGTNAIGTALSEESPVTILGAEHYLRHNAFLTCCASPIFGPDGHLVGVLDISGDYRSHQRHTLGLVRFSSSIVEKRMFESVYAQDILLAFHPAADYLGSPKEGLAAVSRDGQVLAINRQGLELLGIRRVDAVHRDFSMVFESNLSGLVSRARQNPQNPGEIRVNGQAFLVQLRGTLPPIAVAGRIIDTPPPVRSMTTRPPAATLDNLLTGDPQLENAIDRARRILGRDIPLLIQGESGAGKEMFAKAFHLSGPRRDGAFVALNCASIPETLIESELFGYQGGAFTGALKEGAPGKIQQAHGGTLFLDEIGDMPLNLQARLLRVLQERSVTPLGSTRSVQVDISLVCATHRKLREEVARGNFREDLYYRLNGMSITLPALRERTDIRALTARLVTEESANRALPVGISPNAMRRIEQYAWPGNIRQLFNTIRLAVALLDDDETLIGEQHLSDELFETPARSAKAEDDADSLDEIGRLAAQRALEAAGGNISAAARRLGISRNTLYRKLGKM